MLDATATNRPLAEHTFDVNVLRDRDPVLGWHEQRCAVNHNELVYSCPCDTQEVSEMQQVHERVPTTPPLTCNKIELTESASFYSCAVS